MNLAGLAGRIFNLPCSYRHRTGAFMSVEHLTPAARRAALNRRSFLRGLGACVALPLFESLRPVELFATDVSAAKLATTATGAPLRTAFVYFPNGAIPSAWWPTGAEAQFQLQRT